MIKKVPTLATVLILPLALLLVFWAVQPAQAGAPYHICANVCPYPTIQEAVSNHVPEGDTLTIAPETFAENVVITRSMTLVGVAPDLTIIDGQLTGTAVLISGGPTVSISGLSIQNGDTTSVDGGGLRNEDGTVTLSNIILEKNQAPNGAGIANNGTMVLDDVIVRNNVADEIVADVSLCEDCAGGGIYNLSVLTITNSTVHGNQAKYGAGIDNALFGSSFFADNVELYGNTAQNNPGDPDSAGGGIENLGTMTLTNSIVRDNAAPYGAGIANDGTLTVSDSDIHTNIAGLRGGGFHNTFNLTVQTSNIYDNEAGSGGGGGISSESGTVLVAQTAVYNNSAQFGGGIIHNVVAGANSFIITNSTLSGNNALGTGGALRNAGIASTTLNNVTINNNTATVVAGQSVSVFGGTVTAQNSIINSSGTDCSGTLSSNGHNIGSDNSCGLNGTADLSNTNPLLGPLQNNGGSTLTQALLIGSPAIDSGSGCPAVDQRDVARPFGAACDRGAYEFDESTVSVYLPLVIRP